MKFNGQFQPPADQILYENYLKDIKEGIFIECGAGNGVSTNNSLVYERELGWKCINIEASPRAFIALERNRPNSFLNLNVGLSNKNGKAVFNDIGNGNSSFTHKDHQLKAQRKQGIKENKVEVPIITLKKLVEDYNIPKIDAMVLDVEGHEIEIIEGFKDSPVTPDVICMEYPHVCVELNNGLKDLAEIMKGHGYFFNFFANNDAYFSKKDINKNWFGQSHPLKEWIWNKNTLSWRTRG